MSQEHPEDREMREAYEKELEGLIPFVDTIAGWTEQEKNKLKKHLDAPGIQARLRKVKNMIDAGDPEGRHRILLEALKSDLKDFSD